MSTTFPTCSELGSNTIIRSERPAINRLTYGTPSVYVNIRMIDVVSDLLIAVYSFDHIYPVASCTVLKLLVLVYT